jgi:hypothetical protein
MELLTEFVPLAASVAINMALLTEGEKSKLLSLCGTHTSESYKSHF